MNRLSQRGEHMSEKDLMFTPGTAGVPEMWPVVRSHAPNEALGGPWRCWWSLALDNPSAGAIIGGQWGLSCAVCQGQV